MEKTGKLDFETVERMLTPLVWDKLSEEFAWTEELLEKYREQVNWQKVSQNRNIAWKTSMLEKFKEDIDWYEFSEGGDNQVVTLRNLEKFKEYWHWPSLSGNSGINWTYTLLDRFADKWDWRKLVDNWGLENLFSMEFVNRYREHIPFTSLHNSRLGGKVVEELTERLMEQLMETE